MSVPQRSPRGIPSNADATSDPCRSSSAFTNASSGGTVSLEAASHAGTSNASAGSGGHVTSHL
jgi:hypothetical protein